LFKILSYFEQKHFDENAEENLSAAVHIQCRIFLSGLTCKPHNNYIMWRLSNWWCKYEQSV